MLPLGMPGSGLDKINPRLGNLRLQATHCITLPAQYHHFLSLNLLPTQSSIPFVYQTARSKLARIGKICPFRKNKGGTAGVACFVCPGKK
jgi:hypothetical protein